MIKSIIIDDERNSRQLLEALIHRYCPNVQLLGQANSVSDAVRLINERKPNLIFLDIEMPGGDGFELLKQFNKASFLTCFVTGYDNYAVKAIKYGAFDYLLKPVDIKELQQTISKAESALSTNQSNDLSDNIIIQEGDRYWVLEADQIIHITAEGNYSIVHTLEGKKIISSTSLNNYESILEENSFYRCHKSHIININMIRAFELTRTGKIKMKNNKLIPLAARRKNGFTELIKSNRTH